MNNKYIGYLLIVFTLSAIYVSMDGEVRQRIDKDKSTFYVNESNRWLISGVEYNKLFFGTKLIYRHAKDIQRYEYLMGDYYIVKRITPYYTVSFLEYVLEVLGFIPKSKSPVIIDTYTFYTNTTHVELFPVSHEIELFNATGLIYQYEVKRLEYSGETVKGVLSPQSFGKNMKVEWNRIPYYSKIYKYKWKDEGKLTLKYRITSDYEKFNIRLFDPTWWDENWDYKKEIQIDGTGLEIPANYQLFINVSHVTGKMNSTFQGIRFTNSDENVSLDYWVENNVTSDYAEVWVEVPTISNSSNTTIYMYYGNDAVSTTSNGTATFLEFDEFEDLTQWTVILGTPTISTSVYNSGYSSAYLDANDQMWRYINENYTRDVTYYIDGRYTVATAGKKGYITLMYEYGAGGTLNTAFEGDTYDSYYDAAFNQIYDTATNTWYRLKTHVLISSQVEARRAEFFVDGTSYHNATGFQAEPFDEIGRIYIYDNAADQNPFYVDRLLMTEYSASEPSYSFGAEEEALSPIITLNSPTDDSTNTSKTVSFRFTPTDDSGFTSCSLWTNETSWSEKESNTSAIVNNSINTIAETFTNDGSYLWNIKCVNSNGHSNFSASNWTIHIETMFLSTCQTLSENNTVYYVDTDITNGSSSPCFSITGINTTLDCQGHIIDGFGTAAYGIDATQGSDAFQNATIKNCIVQNYTTAGIYVQQNCRNCTVLNNTIKTSVYGIVAVGSYFQNITNNTISGSTTSGIYVSGYNGTFYDNTISTSVDGLYLFGGGRNTIYNNYLGSGNTNGIELSGSGGIGNYDNANTIYNNYISGTTPVLQSGTRYNYFNTTNQTGTRILGESSNIGGNYYSTSTGTGYSDTCDADTMGFCITYEIASNNTDYLPLGYRQLPTKLYLNGVNSNNYYELGTTAQLKANITDINGTIVNETVCIDIGASSFGDDYVCNNGTVEYNWTTISTTHSFENNVLESNFTSNNSINITLSGESELDYAYMGLTGYNTSNVYPEDINITIGNNSILIYGYLNGTTSYIDNFEDITNVTHASANTMRLRLNIGSNELESIILNITSSKNNFSERNIISSEDPLDWDKVETYRINDSHLYTLLTALNNSDIASCVGGGGAWSFYYTESFDDGLSWTSPAHIIDSYCTLGWDFWGSYMGNGSEIFVTVTSGNVGSTHALAYQSIHMFNSIGNRTSWSAIRKVVEGSPATHYYSSNGAETSNGAHHLTYSGGSCNKACYSNSSDAITYTSRNTTLFTGLSTDGYPDISVAKDDTLLINHLRAGYYYQSDDSGITWGARKLAIWSDSCNSECRGLSLFYDSDIEEYIFIQSTKSGTAQFFDGGVYKSTDGINFTKFTTLHFITGVGVGSRNQARDCTYNASTNWIICPYLAEDNSGNPDAGTRTMYEYDFPRDVSIDIADNGVIDYSTTVLGYSQNITINNVTEINSLIGDNDYLDFVYFTGTSAILHLNLDARQDTTSVDINKTNLESYLNGTYGDNTISISIGSTVYGTVEVNTLNISYAGFDNVTIVSHYNGSEDILETDTQYAELYWSDFDIDLPGILEYIEFIPDTPTSSNVTAYGQTLTIPIFNITAKIQGNKNMDWYMLLNESHECVNLTASSNSTKNDGFMMNDSWVKYASNKSYNSLFDIYMWADYNCSYTSWKLWDPLFYFRGCCVGCICSEATD